MSLLAIKVRTVLALGIPNLWHVLNYRMSVKLGFNPIHRIQVQQPTGVFFDPFFSRKETEKNTKKNENAKHVASFLESSPSKEKQAVLSYFGWHYETIDQYPDWHQNPFNKVCVSDPKPPWWEIPDFDPKLGDIKTVWEASRFDWVLNLAQSAVIESQNVSNTSEQLKALNELNQWLNSWCKHNPPYSGVNWKCGQEASIRVMHLSIAASILEQYQSPTDALTQLIDAHLQRIAPTIHYAVAQDNNHGTSEAAALFIGGSWLYSLGNKQALKYQLMGRRWLENRAKRLITSDGTFSQYSVNYHRVMLDTYSMVEYWRRLLQLPEFSTDLYSKLQSATNWLYQMTQVETGDAPNLGANDGARLLPLSATDYRDYRPSIQLASILFAHERAYSTEGKWDEPLQWLKIESPIACKAAPKSHYFAEGGYSLLRHDNVFALFNIPRFKFRPSQADALHVDLWRNGENLLRDGGTYSYNAGDDITQYFGGTASHNTIQFDHRDQMPRLSRFLLGAWLKAIDVTPVIENKGESMTATAYRDAQGVYHHRSIKLSNSRLHVIDTVSGFKKTAVLRWRLKSGEWIVDKNKNTVSDGVHVLKISHSQTNITRFEIVEGWESRYYLQKKQLPVLEVEINRAGVLITEYSFNL